MNELEFRLRGGSLLTAEILYYRPDFPSLLQSFSWQTLDAGPGFPRLAQFLENWRLNVGTAIHSIRIAHADWIGPGSFRSVSEIHRPN